MTRIFSQPLHKSIKFQNDIGIVPKDDSPKLMSLALLLGLACGLGVGFAVVAWVGVVVGLVIFLGVVGFNWLQAKVHSKALLEHQQKVVLEQWDKDVKEGFTRYAVSNKDKQVFLTQLTTLEKAFNGSKSESQEDTFVRTALEAINAGAFIERCNDFRNNIKRNDKDEWILTQKQEKEFQTLCYGVASLVAKLLDRKQMSKRDETEIDCFPDWGDEDDLSDSDQRVSQSGSWSGGSVSELPEFSGDSSDGGLVLKLREVSGRLGRDSLMSRRSEISTDLRDGGFGQGHKSFFHGQNPAMLSKLSPYRSPRGSDDDSVRAAKQVVTASIKDSKKCAIGGFTS